MPKVLALLIGFEYKIKILPGTYNDLQQAKVWCKSNKYDIYVLTDIDHFNDAIMINNESDLVTMIKNILNKDVNKLMIYYSGHGESESIKLPDNNLFSFDKFKNLILSLLNPYTEIFWILDCCNPNGLNLPYKLINDKFKLILDKNTKFALQPILLITSSQADEKSVTTKKGSVFTKNLFDLLSTANAYSRIKNRNLPLLIKTLISDIKSLETGYNQTISCYSSYLSDPVLWMWIGNNSRKEYDLISDMSCSNLIFRPNN